MSNAICDHVLYLWSKGLNNSCVYPNKISLPYLKMSLAIQYSTLLLTGSEYSIFKVKSIDTRSQS